MKKNKRIVDKFVEVILICILVLMVMSVLWQVYTRFLTNNPSSFTDELSRYLMIWLGILGSAYLAGKNEHVAINYFSLKFKSFNKIIELLILFSIILFAFFGLLIGGLRLVYITYILDQYSPALNIPLAYIYTIIPFSGLIIIYYKLSNYLK
ncbi:MAG: TRAP transporter small permease [Flavobacteriaceae bacterium]|jgi:TRAP-type C4-dicarboxylate transport system permease small subunit|nr:TRAP transporter small permease [Flavobacteriaceae bacterium]